MTRPADWAARVGDVWAEEWRRIDTALAPMGDALTAAILAAAPQAPSRCLDVGCGAGATSLALAAARPDAEILGVDLSPALAEVARSRAAAAGARIRVLVAPAEVAAPEHGPFDLLVSRHGVMFFDDPVRAFATLRRAASPGAALVFSCFDAPELNPWSALVEPATPSAAGYAPGPFAFADEARVRCYLEDAGWQATRATRLPFAYRAGAGADPAADGFSFLSRIGPAASALRDVTPEERPAVEARLRAALERARVGGVVEFPASAWIWTARA